MSDKIICDRCRHYHQDPSGCQESCQEHLINNYNYWRALNLAAESRKMIPYVLPPYQVALKQRAISYLFDARRLRTTR